MSQRVIEFPKEDTISRLKKCNATRKILTEEWQKLFRVERLLREQEARLSRLEADVEAEEAAIRKALAAGATVD